MRGEGIVSDILFTRFKEMFLRNVLDNEEAIIYILIS